MIKKKSRHIYVLILLIYQSFTTFGQSEKEKLPLDDLSAFQQQSGNWMIVGSVAMDPSVDVHHEEAPPKNEKKKKRKSKENEAHEPQAVTYQSGTGVLLNLNDEAHKDNLITKLEHGDIELEMDIMLPKGSNSGLYLQGRYELQLFDSWGVKNPKYSDMGGIYRNWETEPGKIYMGKAPLINAAKAPGLWQHLELLFKAPRFDENGNKIQNAKFVYVKLNGALIHENVEIPLPTGGPVANNEVAKGPIMIQGDHGPVAIRNIRYQLIHDLDVDLSDLSYTVSYGDFKFFDDFVNKKPDAEGKSQELTYEVSDKDDAYGISFKGKINVSEDGEYEFFPEFSGGLRLVVDGKQLVDVERTDGLYLNNGSAIDLKKGSHSIEIYTFKNASWRAPRLGLFVKKPDTYKVPLHAFASNPPDEDNVSPIYVNVADQPRLLRAFIDYKGHRDQRITHSIGVGGPNKMHYVYDLSEGNLVCVWRGNFVEATPMWHDRGDGSFVPRGPVQFLINNQQLASLESKESAFPQKSDRKEYRPLGYEIEEATGRPVFKYDYKNTKVRDQIYPDSQDLKFIREVSLESPGATEGLYFKLADGKKIEQMPGNSFAIDDKQYYIKILSGQIPFIRIINGEQELVLPVDGSTIKYSITW